MKVVIQLSIISLFIISCNGGNLLQHKINFTSERNVIEDENKTLLQQICYDKPQLIDDGYCYQFRIVIKDIDKAIERRIIHIESDTALVRCEYGIVSVWNWGNERNQIKGVVEILNWGNETIQLREDIVINDFRRDEVRRLKGVVDFVNK